MLKKQIKNITQEYFENKRINYYDFEKLLEKDFNNICKKFIYEWQCNINNVELDFLKDIEVKINSCNSFKIIFPDKTEYIVYNNNINEIKMNIEEYNKLLNESKRLKEENKKLKNEQTELVELVNVMNNDINKLKGGNL